MAHKYTPNREDGSGVFKDLVSMKEYPHEGGKHAAKSKTQARQAMLVDQAAARRAAEARPKEEKPWYPERVGNIINKTRDERRAEVVHVATTSTSTDAADRNIAYHQKAVNDAKTEGERNQAMRRLSAAQDAREKIAVGEARRDARAAQLADPKLAESISRAEGIYANLLTRPDVSQVYVDLAKKNMLELKHSRNWEAYQVAEQQLEQRYNFEQAAKIANMNASVTLAKQEIKGFASQPGIVPPAEPEPEGDANGVE